MDRSKAETAIPTGAVGRVTWCILCVLSATGCHPQDAISGFLYRERTSFSQAYSESAFSSIVIGTKGAKVFEALGKPLQTTPTNRLERWYYVRKRRALTPKEAGTITLPLYANAAEYTSIEFDEVGNAFTIKGNLHRELVPGLSRGEVRRRLGEPDQALPREDGLWLEYSLPTDETNKTYKVRRILIGKGGTVEKIQRYLWVD